MLAAVAAAMALAAAAPAVAQNASATATPSPSASPSVTPSATPFECPGRETYPSVPIPFGVSPPSATEPARGGAVLLEGDARSFCSGRGTCHRSASSAASGGQCQCSGAESGPDCSLCAGGHWVAACGGCDAAATAAAGYGSAPEWSLACFATDGSGACSPVLRRGAALWAGQGSSAALLWTAAGEAALVDVCPSGFAPCSASLGVSNATMVPALGPGGASLRGAALSGPELDAVRVWPASRAVARCRPCGGLDGTLECSGHGRCLGSADSPSGSCACDAGWGGPGCDVAVTGDAADGGDVCPPGTCSGAGACFAAADKGGDTLRAVLAAAAPSGAAAGGGTGQAAALAAAATAGVPWRCACLPGTGGANCSVAGSAPVRPSASAAPTPTPTVTPSVTPFFTGSNASATASPPARPSPSASPVAWGDADVDEAPAWAVGPWAPCSASCGGGVSARNVTCLRFRRDPVTNTLLTWEVWPDGARADTPRGCAQSLPLAARPPVLRSCGDWPCPAAAVAAVLDFSTAEGADAAALSLTFAQRLAVDSQLTAWVSNASGASRGRITVLGLGPVPAGEAGAAAARLAAAAAGYDTGLLWSGESAALGSRVAVEIAPPTSRSALLEAQDDASDKGSVAVAAARAALLAEPGAEDAASALSTALEPASAVGERPWRHTGPGRWLGSSGVAATGPVPLQAGAGGGQAQTPSSNAGLSLDWIIGLSVGAAVLLGLCCGCLMGGALFNAWWCCLRCAGRAVGASEKRTIERAKRGERTVILSVGRGARAQRRQSAITGVSPATAEEAGSSSSAAADAAGAAKHAAASSPARRTHRAAGSGSRRSKGAARRSIAELQVDDTNDEKPPSSAPGRGGGSGGGAWITPTLTGASARTPMRPPPGRRGLGGRGSTGEDSPLKAEAASARSPHAVGGWH